MLVKSCRKLKIGSLCSCFSSQKPPSRVNRLQTQGFPQCPTTPNGRSHFCCSGGAVCLPGLPSPLPLAFSFSISALWLVVFGHPSPATSPPFFPFLLLLFLFYSLILATHRGRMKQQEEREQRVGQASAGTREFVCTSS